MARTRMDTSTLSSSTNTPLIIPRHTAASQPKMVSLQLPTPLALTSSPRVLCDLALLRPAIKQPSPQNAVAVQYARRLESATKFYARNRVCRAF